MPDFGISRLSALELVNALTPRERQVAELIAMGEPRRMIAKRLRISMRTLDLHLGKVREKLGVTLNGVGRVWFAAFFEGSNWRSESLT